MMQLKRKHIFATSLLLLGGLVLCTTSCDDNDDSFPKQPRTEGEDIKLDLSTYTRADAGVMMQAFYWDVEPRGDWYDIVNSKIEDWAAHGINRIWLAPPAKSQSGGFSMGYDPFDYFDLGEFDQKGTVETRFGSRAELESLIQKAHSNNIEVIADIVLNHNSGGDPEMNPITGTETFTLFNPASGKFPRTYQDFYPGETIDGDNSVFGGFPDLNHNQPNVQEWLWSGDNSVAKFYQSIGFDGWRFDFVKGFDPKWVTAWNNEVGGFSVGENFDGNAQVLKDWVDASGSAAFDFACFFKLDETLDRNKDLTALGEPDNMLRKIYPDKAVTFISNHDTDGRDEVDETGYISYGNKLIAYAYMLTHDGYPTIFYSDYENGTFRPAIQQLIQINSTIASGDIEILVANEDEYIMKRNGDGNNPGLILYMNISGQTKQYEVTTNWADQNITDYTGNVSKNLKTDTAGKVTIQAPPRSYAIWSIGK